MNKSIFMILILLITFGFFTKIEGEDRINNVSAQSQGDVSIEKVRIELFPIRIYDEDDLLEISIEDVGNITEMCAFVSRLPLNQYNLLFHSYGRMKHPKEVILK